MFDLVLNTPLKSEVFPLCLSCNFFLKASSIFLETFSCTYVKVYLNKMQPRIKVTITQIHFPQVASKSIVRRLLQKQQNLKSLRVSTLLQSYVHKNEHGFVIKMKHGKILDFVISGCILYAKISKMVIFGLFFLLFTHLLIFSYNFQLLLTFTSQFYQKCQ